jgi:hypothetical protein
MKYYRLIFRKKDNVIMFSEIQEHEADEEDFQTLQWDRPIIRHVMGGDQHFLALDPTYLDAMALGIGTYQNMSDPSYDPSEM